MNETVEQIVRQEVHKAVEAMQHQVESPETRAAIAAMAADIALLPVRASSGQDIEGLAAALKAEAMNRAMTVRVRAQAAAQTAWTNVVWRVLSAALGTA